MVLAAALAAAPAFAADAQRRQGGDRDRGRHEAQAAPHERDVPRSAVPSHVVVAPRNNVVVAPRYQSNYRHNRAYRNYAYARPLYRPGYVPRTAIVPRVIRPRVVTVVPYRPYVYHPSFPLGVFYGAGGAYPYGYTPRGYYDPIPGRPYGGLRITGAPRDAQVFADGYYVGIVNDFDGVFQHVNLEAGPHHIEIQEPGYDPIAFDVIVQPAQTITYRADIYQQ
jgi:hypothetical protein